MFGVTKQAADEIKKLLSAEDMQGGFLRVRVVPGGCSGFSYEMGFDDETDESDKVFEEQGVKVVVDGISFGYLEGASLDYRGGLDGTGFSISNPNSKGSCGCGQSFNL
ncbi:MAG: iron-sulfur cluster insertion protein ErpA [Candidatus Dadabacteria bacterium]|nr:iron-sulfur cluster insertion protein ErpA [Candidatus Dadabacteria bacterium]